MSDLQHRVEFTDTVIEEIRKNGLTAGQIKALANALPGPMLVDSAKLDEILGDTKSTSQQLERMERDSKKDRWVFWIRECVVFGAGSALTVLFGIGC